MEVLSFLVGTQITGQSRLQGGSLAASCSVTQKQQPATTHTQEIQRQIKSLRSPQSAGLGCKNNDLVWA